MQDFEKLGAFYLGKIFDLDSGETRNELLLYDAKDLTTHAICVGMTGSGKTGLCLSLLEEAAIDGIPAIAIDPKGDLGNLMLTFPELQPEQFRPWIDESAAARAGLSADEYAAQTAKTWRDGLAEWGQQPERIGKFRNAVDMTIYTPGSNAGMPLSVLRSFSAPPPALIDDADAFRERISSAASGLLALVGIAADPLQSREHVLLSSLFDHAWRQGRDLDIATLIHDIQKPPFSRVGILSLDTYYPENDRLKLAMLLNNLVASPAFASWMEGEPLDVKRLLYTAEGKPRISIVSIAHLSDAERMFFVTILLNEVLAWIRTQPGTSSLRALLYMDEIFGYFPPVANPPSKAPMLTLLKQARAYGLGVVLATQNPVDLDYKGLSNTGTWFLGRLQTERDKARVLEGLEGASAQAGANFDRQRMEAILASLKSRIFLMNNVHEDEPVVFQTRWALSYLRGPLTRTQIQTLIAPRKEQATEPPKPAEAASAQTSAAPVSQPERPSPPSGIEEVFLATNGSAPEGCRVVYRPALLGTGRLHFVRSPYHVDAWQNHSLLALCDDKIEGSPWDNSTAIDADSLQTSAEPHQSAQFSALPNELHRDKNYDEWAQDLKSDLYRRVSVSLWRCKELKEYSEVGATEGDFRIRLTQLAREKRDLQIEKLRQRYSSKLATLKNRIESAEQQLDREKSQYHRSGLDTVISFGSSLIGALFGRKLGSRTNVTKASTSMRRASRTAEQRADVGRAEEKLESLQDELNDMEEQFADETKQLEQEYLPESLELEPLSVRPRKGDIQIEPVRLAWTPWFVNQSGIANPAFTAGSQE